MEFKTVAIIGAGAVGMYFIDGLKEKLGENIWVIAEGERKERLQNEGIYLNDERIMINVRTPMEAHGADLVVVAVKYGGLNGVLDMVAQIVDEHTMVISPMNGVDSEEIIGARIGDAHMIHSVMKISSERKGNRIYYNAAVTPGLFVGDVRDGEGSERIKAIVELLDGSGVRCQVCEDILKTIWMKYALNISRNLPQAMVNCCMEAYDKSEHVDMIGRKLRQEVAMVALAKGIDINDDSVVGAKSPGTLPTARFSTLQDLDAGRHTEIDMFSGAMIRMGAELGIPVPYNEFTYHVIKALEEKNDGLFR